MLGNHPSGHTLPHDRDSPSEAERHPDVDIGQRRPHPIHNVNDVHAEGLTTGQRVADAVARNMGSWRFIVVQSCTLVLWVVLNAVAWLQHWDPYPFILLNLALSFQAAYSAPIIMMSQNRQAAKDRLAAELDFKVNEHAEWEVTAIHARLDELTGAQWQALLELQRRQLDLLARIEDLTLHVHRVTIAGTDPPHPADR